MPAPAHAVRHVAARRSRRSRRACAPATTTSACARCATRRWSGSHVPSPLGRLLRLPAVPVPAFADPPFSLLHPDDAAEAMVAAIECRYDGPLNVVGPGAATPWQAVRLGGRVPLPGAAAVLDRRRARRPRSRAPRSRRTSSSCSATAAPARRVARSARSVSRTCDRRSRCCASCSSGRTSSRSRPRARRSHEQRNLSERGNDYGLDVEHVSPHRVADSARVRRRFGGRYPVDPFGLDPQLADLERAVRPRARPRRRHRRASTYRRSGGAVLVVNRGFGVFEPAAVGVAVQRATGRRLRVIGAPTAPFVSGLSRRLGAISRQRARPVDVRARRPPRRGPARADVVAHRCRARRRCR